MCVCVCVCVCVCFSSRLTAAYFFLLHFLRLSLSSLSSLLTFSHIHSFSHVAPERISEYKRPFDKHLNPLKKKLGIKMSLYAGMGLLLLCSLMLCVVQSAVQMDVCAQSPAR